MGNFHERRVLPEGWEWKRLGEIATVGAGGTPSRGKQEYWEAGTIPWVKISDISDKYISETSEKITNEGLENSSAKIFPEGTILISIFATLGDVGILKINSACNQALAGIQMNNSNMNPDFLYYYLKTLKSYFESIGRGVAQNNINLTILKSTKIPLPPPPTQRRIVSILEKAEETKKVRAQADELTDRLLQSVFLEMFGEPVRNPKDWKKVTLGSLITTVEAGPSRKLNDEGRGHVNITSGEVQKGLFLSIKKSKYIDVSEDLTRYYLDRDDILLNYVNSLSQIGKSALYRGECYPAVLGHNIFRIKVDKNAVHPIYLTSSFKTEFFMNQIKMITKPAVNQASFNTKDLKKCVIFIPPLPLQQKFARIVEKIESMRQSQNQSKQQIEDLFSALMQKAFRGEI